MTPSEALNWALNGYFHQEINEEHDRMTDEAVAVLKALVAEHEA